MTYEQLLTAADQDGLLVKEKKLTKHDGLLKGKRIAIRKDIETQAEKSCVLLLIIMLFILNRLRLCE